MDWISQLDRPDAATATPVEGALPVPRHELHLTELVLPRQANHYGTLFGPDAMALLGKAAFLVAARHSQQAVVMASATQIDFLQPVPVGTLLNVHARVVRVGRSAMTVRVSAAFDAAPGTRPEPVLRGDFEMVTVDALGRPCPVQAHAAALPRAAASAPMPSSSSTLSAESLRHE